MNKTKSILRLAISIALTFTFSCSSGDDPSGGGSCDISSYKNKKMPGGKTWMTENLNCKVAGSECYEKKESNCTKYGRLYTWEAANKVCSGGWHLPIADEWEALVAAAGGASTAGKKLKATSSDWNEGGNGTDDYEFAALPGGYGGSDGSFKNVGNSGNWWSATENPDYSPSAYRWGMAYMYDEVLKLSSDKDIYLFSIRCVKD
jgi:uncharacterized protein (TIGR02145 family)